MALTFNAISRAASFSPSQAFPLDARSYFESYDLAVAAAQTAAEAGTKAASNTVYYFGQTLVVNESGKATLYIIQPDKTLKEVGAVPVGDDQSIEVVDGKIQVKGFAKGYYKYNAEIDTHYEYVEGEFISGLEPRVIAVANGKYEIAWYEPNPTTVEGLESQISSLSSTVGGLNSRVSEVEEVLADHETRIISLEGNSQDVIGAVKTIEYEEGTGLFTFKDSVGNVVKEINTAIEKVVANFQYYATVTLEGKEYNNVLVLTLADDSYQVVELGAFIDVYTGAETTTAKTTVSAVEGSNEIKVEVLKAPVADKVSNKLTIEDGPGNYIKEFDGSAQLNVVITGGLDYNGTEVQIAPSGVTTVKIADGAVTEDKLSAEVQAKLNKEETPDYIRSVEENAAVIQHTVEDGKLSSTIVSVDASKVSGKVAEAEKADKVANTLTITLDKDTTIEYDGSVSKNVDVQTAIASAIGEIVIPEVPVQDVTVNGTSILTEDKVAKVVVKVNNQPVEVAEDGSINIEIPEAPEVPVKSISVNEVAVQPDENGNINIEIPAAPIQEIEFNGTKVEPVEGVVSINSPVKDIQVAGTSVVNDNVANITSISTDLLVQGTKTLILDGGGAE